MIFEIISGGEKTDWVGKEWAGLFFPRGKNGPAHSFPGEKTDWGEIPACYTGLPYYIYIYIYKGARWLSGRVLDSRPKGRGFEPHRRHCVVVLEQHTFILA